MATRTRSARTDDQRAHEIKLIHVAKTKLGLDEETYRGLLWAKGRVTSSTQLDHSGRQALLAHFKDCGFVVKGKGGGKGRKVVKVAGDRQAFVDKITALLANHGRPMAYADAIAARITGERKERVELCDANELRTIVGILLKQDRAKGTVSEHD